MRYLGIDFGTKRVGLALSDDEGRMAFPHKVIPNTTTLLDDVLELCEAEHIGAVVIGESKNLKGERNPLQDDIDTFMESWRKRTDLFLASEPEFLTSHQAVQIQGKNDMLDASAAAIILQSYFDRQK